MKVFATLGLGKRNAMITGHSNLRMSSLVEDHPPVAVAEDLDIIDQAPVMSIAGCPLFLLMNHNTR